MPYSHQPDVSDANLGYTVTTSPTPNGQGIHIRWHYHDNELLATSKNPPRALNDHKSIPTSRPPPTDQLQMPSYEAIALRREKEIVVNSVRALKEQKALVIEKMREMSDDGDVSSDEERLEQDPANSHGNLGWEREGSLFDSDFWNSRFPAGGSTTRSQLPPSTIQERTLRPQNVLTPLLPPGVRRLGPEGTHIIELSASASYNPVSNKPSNNMPKNFSGFRTSLEGVDALGGLPEFVCEN